MMLSDNLFSSFLDSVELGVMLTDKDGNFVSVNKAFSALLGFSKEELQGKRFTIILPIQEREQHFREYIQKFSQENEAEKKTNYWYIQPKNGDGFYVNISTFNISKEDGSQYQATYLKKEEDISAVSGFPDIQNTILKNVKDSVVVVSVDGTVLYWNQGATEIFEYQEKEVVGELIYNFWPEERFSPLVGHFRQGNEKLDLFDSLHTRKDGRKRYVDFRITPLYGEHKELTGLIFISQDVTERYLNKKAIREQRNMLASLIDSQTNFLIRLDTEAKFTFANKAFQSHINNSKSLEGISFEKHVFFQDVSLWKRAFKRIMKSTQLQRVELRMVTAGGKPFWVSWELVVLTDRHGKITNLQAVGLDVSESKEMEREREIFLEKVQALNQELRKSEEELRQILEKTLKLNAHIERNEKKFKSLLENSFEAVLVFDEKGIIQYSSPSVYNILGFLPEEMVGKKGMSFVHTEDRDSTLKLLEEVMQKPGEPVFIMQRVRQKSGNYIWIESSSTNLLNDPNVKGIVSNYRDITERHEAEEKLRNSERSLNLAQHIAKFGSVEFDLITGHVQQSSGLYAIYDYDLPNNKENDFVGYDYIHPDDVDKIKRFFLSGQDFGTEWLTNIQHLPEWKVQQLENTPLDYRIISASGKLKHIKSNTRIIRDRSGKPIKNLVTIQDVSEEKHLERMLEDTSFMAKTGGWELNLETKKYFGTPQLLQMLGLPAGTQIPLGEELELFHPDYRELIAKSIENLITLGIPFDLEMIMIPAGKESFWVRIIGRAEMVSGQVVQAKGFIKDITDRKKAEREIKKFADRLRIATEAAGIGVWDWDLQKDQMVWDFQMRKIYNLSEEHELVTPGQWREMVHPADLPAFRQKLAGVPEESNSEFEFRIVLGSGEIKWIKSFAKAFSDKDGQPKRMVGVNWDITSLKATEEILRSNNEELLKINNELDHFVYSTSHNLRAPLTSILGIVELIKSFPDPDEFHNYVLLIEKSVKKLDGTIQEITNYSRNARVEVAAEPIYFKPMVVEMIESLSFLEEAKKIHIHYAIPDDFYFYSDKSRVKMILNNLLSNAIKYADLDKKNPEINILVKKNEGEAVLCIKDNGIGIGQEYQSRVFDMFFRASTKSTGSGLGLYIVREAVQKLNGYLKIDSEPGEGTEFEVHLPNIQPGGNF